MKKRNLLLVMLAILLAFGFMGCPLEEEEEEEDWTPDAGFFGTYNSTYGTSNITETIVFDVAKFKISDDDTSNGGGDYLEFAISEFDEIDAAAIPAAYKTAYPKGFIFKGKITAGKPIAADTATGNSKNIYGPQTAPNLSQKDVNTTELKMFIYYNDSSAIKFIRTAFVKVSEGTPNVIMTSSGGSTPRVYQ